MTTKNEILDAAEETIEVVNRFGDVVGEGYRTENWFTGFRLSDDSVIRFDQVEEVKSGKLVLK